MTGASPAAMAALLEGMGADAIGANCSLGPRQLRGVMEELLRVASVPVVLKPNAGLPKTDFSGRTVVPYDAQTFAAEIAPALDCVDCVGSCCGCDPSYVRALAALLHS